MLFLFSATSFGQVAEPSLTVKLGLLSGGTVTRLLLAPDSAVYSIFAGDSLITLLNRNDVVSVMLLNDSLQLKSISSSLGSFKAIKVTPLVTSSSLKVKSSGGKNAELVCDGSLIISSAKKSMHIVNEVDMDNYVAGVVQAETGVSAPKEYYKIQAIMCRTFALETIGKHSADGYDLCDRDHCQVYKGRNNTNPEIKLAVAATSGIVLADGENKLVFAAYHSNCGGQTDYSENVWKTEKSYLKPVVDSFCLNSRNATWEKIISLEEWENYLRKQDKNYLVPADSVYHFYQESRKSNYELFGMKIPLTQMRKDLKLNSTFFRIEQKADKIIFNGRGSGHGVGLCQQGAIEMARKGYSYKKILGYYYKGVKLIDYKLTK